MPNLFMVMLGGRHARANTEVHDVVFAVADSLEESYPQLKNAWFGEQKGLHIDAWMQVEGVESAGKKYQIQFSDAQPQAEDEKLWLINLGGYDTREFGELHRYVLVVAPNAVEAKQLGKQYFDQKCSVHDKFHRTLVLSGFFFLKIASTFLNSSFFPKPIKRRIAI